MKKLYNDSNSNVITNAYNHDSTRIHDCLRDKGMITKSFDMVVTSPPYINAINYPMFNRYELFLLRLIDPEKYLQHQRGYLGTERVYAHEYARVDDVYLEDQCLDVLNRKIKRIYQLEPKRAYITKRYFEGMIKSIKQIYHLLKQDGKFILVAGSNTIKGVEIPTYNVLRQCAEEVGFSTVNAFSYHIQKHRFKITRHETGKKIDIDNIVIMRRS